MSKTITISDAKQNMLSAFGMTFTYFIIPFVVFATLSPWLGVILGLVGIFYAIKAYIAIFQGVKIDIDDETISFFDDGDGGGIGWWLSLLLPLRRNKIDFSEVKGLAFKTKSAKEVYVLNLVTDDSVFGLRFSNKGQRDQARIRIRQALKDSGYKVSADGTVDIGN